MLQPPCLRAMTGVFPRSAYALGVPPGVDRYSDHVIDVHEGKFVFDGNKVPHIAIAAADPRDRDAWRAAQAQCAAATRTGVECTLLFAARSFPECQYPFDPRTLFCESDGGSVEGADVVINIASLNLREDFPRMVYAATQYMYGPVGSDFSDFREVLGDEAKPYILMGPRAGSDEQNMSCRAYAVNYKALIAYRIDSVAG